MSFEDVSQALNKLVATVTDVYRGYWQHAMVESIFAGLLIGEPVLLIGSHGVMKTSMANFVGSLFDKPVATVKESFHSRSSLEKYFEDIGSQLKINPENLTRNLVDGIDVQYEQIGDALTAKVEIDVVKHSGAAKFAETTRKPIKVFSMQVNDQMDPEDILGYGIDHPAILGLKPPHAIKSRRVAGADYVCLDEIFGATRLLSKLHHVLNEKVVDTTVGSIEAKPLGIMLCTNPLNQFYQTNVAIMNAASIAGDEPICLKINNKLSVMPIAKFVDPFFKEAEEGEKTVNSTHEVLAFNCRSPAFSKFARLLDTKPTSYLNYDTKAERSKLRPATASLF